MRTLINIGMAAALATSLASSAYAAPKQQSQGARNETVLVEPFVCRTDEGYGRYSTCDQGH